MFYTFISDDGKIDYPISSICKILDISYYTAKKIKEQIKKGENSMNEKEAHKYISNKSEEHPMIDIIIQTSKLWNKKLKPIIGI